MHVGLIGLGKMGMNMSLRLLRGGHHVVAYDTDPRRAQELIKDGGTPAASLDELVQKLGAAPGGGPKVIWAMVPSGKPTQSVVDFAVAHLSKGDIFIDGGNSNFRDSQARAKQLAEKGIGWLDAGTSGGIWGLTVGYCLMVGGSKADFAVAEPIFKTLAPPEGYLHAGPVGSGHFVKMVHNGIEYGLMQAYAEGFEILKTSEFAPDLEKVAHLWGQGSVVRSWLLELLEKAFKEDGNALEQVKGYVEDSGEGRWTVQAAIDQNVAAPVITLSLLARIASRQDDAFSNKVTAALRGQFGGHAVQKEGGK